MSRRLADVQAVVFAGGSGNRMMALTEQIPKALLPVANLPLYWHALNLLWRNSIHDVILVTNASCDSAVRNALNTLLPLPGLNIEIFCPSSNANESDDLEQYGTADVLRLLQRRIKPNHDILLMSGDIVSDFSLEGMFSFHCKNSSILTCLFSDTMLNGPTPGPKSHHKKHRDLTAILPESGQLLYLCEEDDFEHEEEFSTNLFQRFSKIQFTAKYKDAYLYLMDSNIMELLRQENERQFSSIKADLIPYLLKGQYTKIYKSIASFVNASNIDENSRYCPYRCFAYRSSSSDGLLIAQCNTIAVYFEANKAIQKVLKNICQSLFDSQRDAAYFKTQKANVSDCLVHATSSLSEKSILKRSQIGRNCTVGEKARIENSLLMDGVVVHAGAIVKSSIVFPNVIIEENAEVNMCIVGTDQKVSKNEKFSNTIMRVENEMSLDE